LGCTGFGSSPRPARRLRRALLSKSKAGPSRRDPEGAGTGAHPDCHRKQEDGPANPDEQLQLRSPGRRFQLLFNNFIVDSVILLETAEAQGIAVSAKAPRSPLPGIQLRVSEKTAPRARSRWPFVGKNLSSSPPFPTTTASRTWTLAGYRFAPGRRYLDPVRKLVHSQSHPFQVVRPVIHSTSGGMSRNTMPTTSRLPCADHPWLKSSPSFSRRAGKSFVECVIHSIVVSLIHLDSCDSHCG
jgi:hypothetical protein